MKVWVQWAFCMGILQAQGQNYFYNNRYYDQAILLEAGAFAGAMNCLTDLGGKSGEGKPFIRDLNVKNTHFCGGLYAGLMYINRWGVRLEATVGRVSASDSILKNDNSVAQKRYQRNLHFQSTIAEIMIVGEFHPLSFLANEDREKPFLVSPYLCAGIGLFHFNPQANLDGIWMDLQPLHTEGQGFKEYPGREEYKTTDLVLPAGLGIRFELGALVHARFELLHRFLSTDYLDDVSAEYIDPEVFSKYHEPTTADKARRLADRRQELDNSLVTVPGETRGNPRNKDSFFSVNIKLGIILNRKRRT